MSALEGVKTRLGAKAGPLRVWQWGALGGVGVLALLWWGGRGRRAGDSSGSYLAMSATPAYSDVGYDAYGYGDDSPSSGPVSSSGTLYPTPAVGGAPIAPDVMGKRETPSTFTVTTPQVIPTPSTPSLIGQRAGVLALRPQETGYIRTSEQAVLVPESSVKTEGVGYVNPNNVLAGYGPGGIAIYR